MTDEEYVPFTARYGINGPAAVRRWCDYGGEDFQANRWRGRHELSFSVFAGLEELECYVDPLFRCVCPGSGLRRADPRNRCAERASQEDRLCDFCRQWCHAVDDEGRYHRFVDLYGSMA